MTTPQRASPGTRLVAVRSAAGWGVRIDGFGASYEQLHPVAAVTRDAEILGDAVSYDDVEECAGGFVATGKVQLAESAVLLVRDEWRLTSGAVRMDRTARVQGSAAGQFMSRLSMRRADLAALWNDVEPFVPGVAYGNARRVSAGSLAGWPARHGGIETALIREDRMGAPLVAVRFADGAWLAVLHTEPDAATVAADCVDPDGGETLVDSRMAFGSLGGTHSSGNLELGMWFPGTEGEHTYTSGGLPLGQPHRWRRRFHPIRDGLEQQYSLLFRTGSADAFAEMCTSVWRWAWDTFKPIAAPADTEAVVRSTTRVLASQVATIRGLTGVPLEVDSVHPGRSEGDSAAVMGFVGANTDAGYVLLRVGERLGGAEGAEYRRLGLAVLDTFVNIPLQPPAAEGFDTRTGDAATYRDHDGAPAVYARAVAEGCLATLDAWEWERSRGTHHSEWLRWARAGGDWLVAQQHEDGGLPRAWAAGTGAVLDDSPSSSYAVVPFLTRLANSAQVPAYLDAAVRAGTHAWAEAGRDVTYAGATLDNPDVVDKEAAMLAAEAFVALHEATGERTWLDRAVAAASLAETWIYIWNVPMPIDADDLELHWKRDVPTAGHQLITTGASMADGFLAVNAAAFGRLWAATGDPHWLEVARLVTHGTTAMLARDARTFDLRGPGWQQEHWCFGGRRGYGLNRRWLPWVAVAHAGGILRVEELGADISAAILGGEGTRSDSESP